MLAYFGSSSRRLNELISCLKLSSEKDPLNGASHDSGWGYVLIKKDSISYYRSGKPIFKETIPVFLDDEDMIAIFHARKATTGLVGSQFSHPYMETNESGTHFFAHNGTINKRRLAQKMGIEDQGFVDSELAFKYLINTGDIETLKDYTETALNLFYVKIDRYTQEAELRYLNYVAPHHDRPYYHLYIDTSDGIAVYSSSLAYLCKDLSRERVGKGFNSIGKIKVNNSEREIAV
ncbi:class II glutamine amidotransferase [Sulfuracidifex tepidarius]|nr:class II glutamine amidotransferase [Sulfuracidifex tepidarius]